MQSNSLTLQVICGVSFYIAILLTRINARVQVLLRQGFGIPSENEKRKSKTLRNTREI